MVVIVVDVDGTLAATDKILQSRYNVPPHEYPAKLPEGFWESPEGLVLYRDVEPIPGAVESLRKLSQRFYVVYATVRPRVASFVTARWIRKHGFPVGPVFFCNGLKHKARLQESRGVIGFIDDDPDFPGMVDLPVFLVDRPYNRQVQSANVVRFCWADLLAGKVSVAEGGNA